MDTRRKQQTIHRPGTASGFGYWSGSDVQVEFRPAEQDTGVVFVRRDLADTVRIPASVKYRIPSSRRTTLAVGDSQVEMVEHILAALAGLQIDNCEVWVDAPEMPGCDGSSIAFVDALLEAGIVEQSAPRQQLQTGTVPRLGDSESWIETTPGDAGEFTVDYMLDYGANHPIGQQRLTMTITPESFAQDLANCRTFLTWEEAQWLQSQGLGTRATTSDLLVFGEHGVVDNQLRHPDECVRHKVLDLVGDLALSGCDLAGHVRAYRSGHRLNAELVGVLLGAEQESSAANHGQHKRSA